MGTGSAATPCCPFTAILKLILPHALVALALVLLIALILDVAMPRGGFITRCNKHIFRHQMWALRSK